MSGTDGRPLAVSVDVSAIPPRAAGAGQYVLALARELAAAPSAVPTLLTRRDDAPRWAFRGASVAPVAPRHRPARLAWEQVGLPRWLAANRPDVHHGPHYTMPERTAVPTVVTIHDCTFFDHPEWHQRTKVLVFRRAIQVAARRADALVCVSATTAERLATLCAPRAPVFVAPHGVDRERFTPAEPEPGSDARELRGVGVEPNRPYVAFVGTIEPRKGVATLIRAFASLRSRHPDLRLVLAGQEGWGTEEVGRAIAETSVADRLVRVGYVPDPAVPALLRRAAVVAYPSLAEGYGLPALEALSCGSPLVTTSGTAMAELAGEVALTVPPGDAAALAGALDEVLHEGGRRTEDRRRRGLAVAARHTWSASLARHLEAYRAAAGLDSRPVG